MSGSKGRPANRLLLDSARPAVRVANSSARRPPPKGSPRMWRPLARRIVFAAVAIAAVCSSSCSRGKTFYPVHGKLLVNGKPAEGVNIVLYLIDDPDTKPLQPSGSVGADGTFEI